MNQCLNRGRKCHQIVGLVFRFCITVTGPPEFVQLDSRTGRGHNRAGSDRKVSSNCPQNRRACITAVNVSHYMPMSLWPYITVQSLSHWTIWAIRQCLLASSGEHSCKPSHCPICVRGPMQYLLEWLHLRSRNIIPRELVQLTLHGPQELHSSHSNGLKSDAKLNIKRKSLIEIKYVV